MIFECAGVIPEEFPHGDALTHILVHIEFIRASEPDTISRKSTFQGVKKLNFAFLRWLISLLIVAHSLIHSGGIQSWSLSTRLVMKVMPKVEETRRNAREKRVIGDGRGEGGGGLNEVTKTKLHPLKRAGSHCCPPTPTASVQHVIFQ